MLVLNRRIGEQIVIGQNIIVTIVNSNSTNVRIGIEAPESFHILRRELVDMDAVYESRKSRPATDRTESD